MLQGCQLQYKQFKRTLQQQQQQLFPPHHHLLLPQLSHSTHLHKPRYHRRRRSSCGQQLGLPVPHLRHHSRSSTMLLQQHWTLHQR